MEKGVSEQSEGGKDEPGNSDEEDAQRRTEEQQRAQEAAEEVREKLRNKLQFRQKNLSASSSWMSEEDVRKLDGSIKKNSAFVKKLRTMTEAQKEVLSSDFRNLNLSKYIQEAATNLAEAKLKLADISCAVHICSLLHCRYQGFAELLLEQLQKNYSGPIKKTDDKAAVTSKYRLGLRLLGELVLSGVVNEDVGLSLLSDMLSGIIAADKETHAYLGVVLTFARQHAEDVAGIPPRKQRLLLSKHGIQLEQAGFISSERQRTFREMLYDYFTFMKHYLLHEHKEMQRRERKNRRILQNKGELSADRLEENDKFQKSYEKLLNNMSTLSDILDLEMPDLPEDQTPQEVSDVSIDIHFPSFDDAEEFNSSSLWEDPEQRSFYEDITDIRPFIPAILYEGNKRKKTESESSTSSVEVPESLSQEATQEATEELNEDQILEQVIRDTEELTIEEEEESMPIEEPEETGKSASEQTGQLEELLTRLPTIMNRKFVDEFATEFCLTMNTKSNRVKLVRTLFNVDKNRMDLVPFYARLVATLDQCLPDVAPQLADMLVRSFKSQVRLKDQTYIQAKIKNARFIAELTKFGLCHKPETMRCITHTLQDFTHHNVELACILIEHCGRYLLRSQDSHLRARALLEIMVRKKRVQHLDGRQNALVENALYIANPPESVSTERVVRPPMLEYIRKLLYKDLNKGTIEKILRQFRKLNWKDTESNCWAVQSLISIWNMKFSNVHCVADLLAGLKQFQEDVTIQVVDGVLEEIRLGLEINHPRLNQRRICTTKFLGELYNYQLVEANVVFRVLYLFITFGCTSDGSPSVLDPFDSYFRARLVCCLLDTCGMYFDHGSTKKKLDTFLVFFQCYLFNKRQPLPLEVEHMITDTICSLRPNLGLFATAAEAFEAAVDLEKKFHSRIGEGGEEGEESDEDDVGSGASQDGGLEEEEEGDEPEANGEDEEAEEEGDEDGVDIDADRDDFEDDILLSSGPAYKQCEEDTEFQFALDKMMSEFRKTDTTAPKIPVVDVGIPMHLRSSGNNQQLVTDTGAMKFTLMTKKGNKPLLKDLEIPVDSELVNTLRDSQQALQDEKQELKRLVLNYERRQEEEEYQSWVLATKQQLQPTASSSSWVLAPRQQHVVQQPKGSYHAHQQPHHSQHTGTGAGSHQRRPYSQPSSHATRDSHYHQPTTAHTTGGNAGGHKRPSSHQQHHPPHHHGSSRQRVHHHRRAHPQQQQQQSDWQ